MSFKKMSEITPDGLRELRESLGLTLKQFWVAVGSTVSCGNRYETGKTSLPLPVRILVFMHYSAGIPVSPDSKEFKDFMEAIGGNMRADRVRKLVKDSVTLLNQSLSQIDSNAVSTKETKKQ